MPPRNPRKCRLYSPANNSGGGDEQLQAKALHNHVCPDVPRDWLNFSQQLPFTHHVSCRDFMLDPDGVLDDLTSRFGFTRKAPGLIGGISFPCVFSFGKCVSRDVQAKKDVYLSGQYMGEFNDFVLSAINAWLDPNLEALFGYRLFGDVGNASVPYNSKTKCLVHGACQ